MASWERGHPARTKPPAASPSPPLGSIGNDAMAHLRPGRCGSRRQSGCLLHRTEAQPRPMGQDAGGTPALPGNAVPPVPCTLQSAEALPALYSIAAISRVVATAAKATSAQTAIPPASSRRFLVVDFMSETPVCRAPPCRVAVNRYKQTRCCSGAPGRGLSAHRRSGSAPTVGAPVRSRRAGGRGPGRSERLAGSGRQGRPPPRV